MSVRPRGQTWEDYVALNLSAIFVYVYGVREPVHGNIARHNYDVPFGGVEGAANLQLQTADVAYAVVQSLLITSYV